MNRWNQAPLIREQVVLFSPTLDAAISEDHSVRLVDEVLRQMDWSAWEQRYFLLAGQALRRTDQSHGFIAQKTPQGLNLGTGPI